MKPTDQAHLTRTIEAYFPPPETQGGWRSLVPALVAANEEPTPEQKAAVRATTGFDWDKLNEVWRYCTGFGGPHAVLVIRHGWIVAEWRNYTETETIASCTKSLTGLAMAKLFDMSDAGLLPRRIHIDDEAWQYLPAAWSDMEPARKHIRLRHMLTMTSGLTPQDGPANTPDRMDLLYAQTVEAPPGTVWAYSNPPEDLLSLVIEEVTGRTMERFLDEEVHAAIGATHLWWLAFNGHTHGCGGARYEPRELARLGYLVLRQGAWGAGSAQRQVISAARIAEFTQHATWLDNITKREPNFAFEPHSNRFYGHLWWTNHTGESLGDAVPRDVVYMSGWGKQACFVAPSLDMVVVRLGHLGELNNHPEFYKGFWQRLMPALTS